VGKQPVLPLFFLCLTKISSIVDDFRREEVQERRDKLLRQLQLLNSDLKQELVLYLCQKDLLEDQLLLALTDEATTTIILYLSYLKLCYG
jgi:hypothetical protein